MAFSLKKRSQSKSQILVAKIESSKSLGEVLHRSGKTKKKDKNLPHAPEIVVPPDNNADLSIKSSPTSERAIIYRSRCLCDTHHERELMAHDYQLAVDKLFDLMFGSNEFVRTYREAQRFYDDTATEWTTNDTTNYRERILTYKVPYESTFVGKGTIFTREKQILFHEVPGSHYMLETEVCNTGVKFSDTFSLIIRYCLVQTSSTKTSLRVTAQVVYNKSVIRFVKQIIERNAYSASQEGLKDLNNRLNLILDFQMGQGKSEEHQNSLIPPLVRQRRLSRSENSLNVLLPTEPVRRISHSKIVPTVQPSTVEQNRPTSPLNSQNMLCLVIFMLGVLLLMHIYLCLKLKRVAAIVDSLAPFSQL